MKNVKLLSQVIRYEWQKCVREQRLSVRVVPDKTKYCRKSKHRKQYD